MSDIALTLRIAPASSVSSVRLHYRPVNQLAKFKTIEKRDGPYSFTIPASDISPKWDLMYYFEILNTGRSGWFQPDPHTATPYYVIKTALSSQYK